MISQQRRKIEACARVARELRERGFVPLRSGYRPERNASGLTRAQILQNRMGEEDTGGEGVWYETEVVGPLGGAGHEALIIVAETRASAPHGVRWVPRWVALAATSALSGDLCRGTLRDAILQGMRTGGAAVEAAFALGGIEAVCDLLEELAKEWRE